MKFRSSIRNEMAGSFEEDPALASLLDQLRLVDSVPVPALQFTAPVDTPFASRHWYWPAPTTRLLVPAAVGAVVVVVAALGMAAGPMRAGSASVSAASILDKASHVAAAQVTRASSGSFHKVTRAETDHGGLGVSIREWRQWGDGPDRWRVEVYAGAAEGELALESVRASDGITLYSFETASGDLTTEPYDAATWRVYGSDGGLGGVTDQASLDAVIAAKAGCFTPRLAGKDLVAGREAYVIDLGTNTCVASADAGLFQGKPVYFLIPKVLWIDVETFSIVRETKVGGPDDQLTSSTALVSYERGVPVDAKLFTVDPGQPMR